MRFRWRGFGIDRGSARTVLITPRYVVKIPRLGLFREGWEANREELARSASHDPGLCPIIATAFRARLIVMPYARPLTFAEFDDHSTRDALSLSTPFSKEQIGDFKRSNFGMLDGRVVRVDYEGPPVRRRLP